VIAYSNAPLDIVQPCSRWALVVVLILGSRLMGEVVRPSHYAAVAAIIAGVAIMAAAGPDHRQPTRGGIAQLTVMAVLAIGIAAPYVLRDRRWRGAALLPRAPAWLRMGEPCHEALRRRNQRRPCRRRGLPGSSRLACRPSSAR